MLTGRRSRLASLAVITSLLSWLCLGSTVGLAASTFSTGELAINFEGIGALTNAGCGANDDGEPSVHVSRANQVLVGSERSFPLGSDAWVSSNLLNSDRGSLGG